MEQEQCHRRPNEIWVLVYGESENSLEILYEPVQMGVDSVGRKAT